MSRTSDCCDAPIWSGGMCSFCKEHCEPMPDESDLAEINEAIETLSPVRTMKTNDTEPMVNPEYARNLERDLEMEKQVRRNAEKVTADAFVKRKHAEHDRDLHSETAMLLKTKIDRLEAYIIDVREKAALIANNAPEEKERFIGRQMILLCQKALIAGDSPSDHAMDNPCGDDFK